MEEIFDSAAQKTEAAKDGGFYSSDSSVRKD